ncbi:regulatory protein RecX [Pedobacter puniceum]|jgi:regulatory protein|uniref:Regulatory protein RecX n=1 Tax=Pedobacter puniceum TaxID=2666136 RepID=A0A7K0FMN9_9SPHI|nr:regulatory protein RecX [Pedobacter puniceum]MRX46520.1 RecX family transcriptional regulator [Pedobacter puniceum]
MEKEKPLKYIDKKTALQKAEAYCAYQERSQYEVRTKLLNLGLKFQELEEVITALIENNFLNEARFAQAFTQGKLRMKGWGRNKIKQGLVAKGVSVPIIKSALQKINKEEYTDKLIDILKKKHKEYQFKDDYGTKNKLIKHALSRGFEYDLIFFVLNNNGLKQ